MNIMKFKFLIIVLTFGMLWVGCADEELKPIITFDDAGKGAYPARISETDKLINLFDIAGSSYMYSVEFIDLEKGNLVAEYALDLTYEDNNPDNGDNSTGPTRFKAWTSADFVQMASGLKGIENITITGPEAISAAGTSNDQVLAGDKFIFTGTVTTVDGAVFRSTNSSATVNGAAFRGHFDFTLPAGCPSALEGTYAYDGTEGWCGEPVDGNVDIIALGGGTYTFSDWSFGAYKPCYGATSVADSESLTFQDVCAEVSFVGNIDAFGDTWTYTSSIEGDKWTITWENTYGESGTGVITHPSGSWPFTLKE